jgi:hypothetical protein
VTLRVVSRGRVEDSTRLDASIDLLCHEANSNLVISSQKDKGDKIKKTVSPKPSDEGRGRGRRKLNCTYEAKRKLSNSVPPSSQSSERRWGGGGTLAFRFGTGGACS